LAHFALLYVSKAFTFLSFRKAYELYHELYTKNLVLSIELPKLFWFFFVLRQIQGCFVLFLTSLRKRRLPPKRQPKYLFGFVCPVALSLHGAPRATAPARELPLLSILDHPDRDRTKRHSKNDTHGDRSNIIL
jgi:hypothetical protein